MRSEQETRELVEELSKLTGFIGESGIEKEFQSDDFKYCSNVSDALDWVSAGISPDGFRSNAYLNLTDLKGIARRIEARTGKNPEWYA